jgi:hypothetical protein
MKDKRIQGVDSSSHILNSQFSILNSQFSSKRQTHNPRFVALMDAFMPKWQYYRDMLNALPVKHERWDY